MKRACLLGIALLCGTRAVAPADDSPAALTARMQKLRVDVAAVGGTVQYSTTSSDVPIAISLYDGNNPLKGKGGLNTKVNDEWLECLAGLTTLTALDLANCDVHGEGLRRVAASMRLQSLNLTLTPFTDADLAALAPFRDLTSMSLASTKCTGEGFRHLQSLTKLNNLNMHFTPVNDAGLAAIAKVGELERLWIVHGRFTDAAGESLAAHKNLRRLGIGSQAKTSSGRIVAAIRSLPLVELELFDSQATDEGVAAATEIRTLRLLNVSYAPTVTDAALEAVALMPALEEFKLAGAKVTDAGLLKLAAVKSLKKIALGKMKSVTADGLEQLRKARPDVLVESP